MSEQSNVVVDKLNTRRALEMLVIFQRIRASVFFCFCDNVDRQRFSAAVSDDTQRVR